MKTLALLVLLVVAPVVEAQVGRVATDYIRITTQPAFQYRSDQDVLIPLQARVVHGGVPQPDFIHLEVRTPQGQPVNVTGAAGLRDGVAPYPHVVNLDLGRLEPGLYRITVHATGGGLSRDWPVEFDVVYPPRPYSATLLGTHDNQARFVFRAHDARDNFTLTLYRDGDAGPVILQQVTTNRTTLDVPYIPGQSIKVSVTDPHGWKNSQNALRDLASGFVTYPPYEWNPDYRQITNYQRHSWTSALAAGAILVVGFGLLLLRRRRA
jgi:hypothetical protein